MMIEDNSTQDAAAIERGIRQTQDDMSRTVDKLGNQLTAKNLFNALLDKADENGVDANYLIDGARRNPIALGLIAAGAIWLVSDKNSKFPSMSNKSKRDSLEEPVSTGSDVHHRDYVNHMSSLEMRDGEDPSNYQRRRDTHRATFLMCERKPDEDDHSFRQRLDDLTENFRQKRQAWTESASQTSSAAMEKTQQLASQASSGVRDLYDGNPLIGGIFAAAIGAALGSAIPLSRTEEESLGDIGAKARDIASEQKDQLTSAAMEKKDELLEKVDQKLQPEGRQQSPEPHERQPEPAPEDAASFQSEEAHRSPSDGPFIISERSM
jgi:hypothetical protein